MAERFPIQFGGLFNSEHESKAPRERCWRMSNCTVENGVLEGGPRPEFVGARSGAHAGDAGFGLGYGEFSSNEVQRIAITGEPTGGTFTLTYDAQTTAGIAHNATADDVRAALAALPNLQARDLSVTGGPLPNVPVDVMFRGDLANTDVPNMTGTSSLSGGTPVLTVTERVKGGPVEALVSAVRCDGDTRASLYRVDPQTGAHTAITTDSLHASDWFFEQYGNALYGLNETDGLQFYRLNGLWNDGAQSGPNSGVAPPISAPEGTVVSTADTAINFSPTGLNATASSSSPGTYTFAVNAGNVKITRTSAASLGFSFALELTWATPQDWSQSDIFYLTAEQEKVGNQVVSVFPWRNMRLELINNDSTPKTIAASATGFRPTSEQGRGSTFSNFMWAAFAGDRSLRRNIVKVRITLPMQFWIQNEPMLVTLTRGHTWIHNIAPIADPSNEDEVKSGRNEYAYTYYDKTNNKESALSPVLTFGPSSYPLAGLRYRLTAPGTADLLTSDRVWFYRREKATGKWRRLPTDALDMGVFGVANATSGNVAYEDFWMESDLKSFPDSDAVSTGFMGTTVSKGGAALTSWKQSMVVGAERQVWLSFVGRPQVYAPSRDDLAATQAFVDEYGEDDGRGRTVYLADNRSESVLGAHGQDSLYAIGPRSTYAMVGDSPAEASPPRRLPGSKGAVGKRAHQKFGGGVHVGSANALYFYAVGRGFSGEDNGALTQQEETREVRASWQRLIATNPEDLVVVEHDDEVWCFCRDRYLRVNLKQQWEEGVWPVEVKAAVSVRGAGLYVQARDGKIYRLSESKLDPGGEDVGWTYETGILDGPRAQVQNMHVHAKGQPEIVVRVYERRGRQSDGYGRYDDYRFQVGGGVWVRPIKVPPSSRMKFFFSGRSGDEVHTLAFEVSQSPKAYGE